MSLKEWVDGQFKMFSICLIVMTVALVIAGVSMHWRINAVREELFKRDARMEAIEQRLQMQEDIRDELLERMHFVERSIEEAIFQ